MSGKSASTGGALRGAAAATAVLILGAGARAAGDSSMAHLGPENIGTYGTKVDDLYRAIFWLTTITFVVTESLLVYCLLRFRARPGGQSVYTHGHHTLEVVWTIATTAILFAVALIQMSTWKEIKITRPEPAKGLVVQVMGRQFEWHFRYAGPDGKFGTDDDVTNLKELHVPVDTNVTVLLRSQDVLHSFFLPYLRLKQDTVPGMTIPQWFRVLPGKTTAEARKARGNPKFDYEIACAELCGAEHSQMRGLLIVDTKDEFFKWIDEAYATDVRVYGPSDKSAVNLHWPATENRTEDAWLRDNWPADLKKAWPKK